MLDENAVRANFWNESTGYCDCCGQQSKTIWGDLGDTSGTKTLYFVQWTIGKPEHLPCFDLVLGSWEDGTSSSDRFLVSLLYQPRSGGGSFMVVSGIGRPADDRSICGRVLERAEVVDTELATTVFSLVDSLWLSEPRIEAIRALDAIAK